MLKKQTIKKKTTFLNLTQNQAKDFQQTLKRTKRRKTDAESPLIKNTNHRTAKRNQNRKRSYSETLSDEKITEQSEKAVKNLNTHLQSGTCPKTLQYKARARIRADEAFKIDIKKIRQTPKQEVINALISYHERRIAECKKTLKRQKRPILNQGTVNKKSKGNKNTTNEQNVIELKRNEFRSMMNKMSNKSCEKYTVYPLSSTDVTRVYKKTTNNQNRPVKSVKNAKPQKTQAYKRAQLERNKGYINNLSRQKITLTMK